MALCNLLTYRQDIPQEGRFAVEAGGRTVELRVAIMPTTHGLRAAVRLPADLLQPRSLNHLNLPPRALAAIDTFIASDSGMLVVSGPAGSGKTTTLYAILEAINHRSAGLSIVTLEDPVERDLPGVTQIQVQPHGQLTYERALRSILRQDPQVLMLGEIRDAVTASLAVQAALSGHRLLCTLHATTPVACIARLMEMGVEPYQLSATLAVILSQRLVRCRKGDGYVGRMPLAEAVVVDDGIRSLITRRASSSDLTAAISGIPGYETVHAVGRRLIREGLSDEAEIRRVLGVSDEPLC
jgi:general secretion pathway protein E